MVSGGRGVAALSPRPQHDYYDYVHAGGCFVPASPTRNPRRGETHMLKLAILDDFSSCPSAFHVNDGRCNKSREVV